MVDPLEVADYCEQMATYGVKATTLTIPWKAVEPFKGVFYWRRADEIIQQMRSCGLTLGAHILSDSSWATLPPPDPNATKIPSMPPYHMDDYYNFMFQLAKHYKGEISRYSIENEGVSESNWGGTPQQYMELLATAQQAVHAADPNAIVLNDGLSSSGVGLLMAMELYNSGQEQEAVDWFNGYLSNGFVQVNGEPLQFSSVDEFADFIQIPLVQRLQEWTALVAAHQDSFDAFQLHFYAPPDYLSTVMTWVRNHLEAQGSGRPIELWELSYGWRLPEPLDLQDQADGVAQLLTTAAGEGSPFIIYWRLTDQVELAGLGITGLFTSDGPRPAADAYRTTVENLTSTSGGHHLKGKTGVVGYGFNTSPDGTLQVVWSQWTSYLDPVSTATGNVIVTDSTGNRIATDLESADAGDRLVFIAGSRSRFGLFIPLVHGQAGS